MKNIIIGLFFVLVILVFTRVFAGEPGSASDPLVTKSFLEEGYGWHLTTVASGDKLPLDMGSELILRSGRAVVVSSKAGGIADLTLGEDLPDGVVIPANHYLVSSSADGRGVRAVTTSVLLTRGLTR